MRSIVKQSGFSLLEMIVVVATILILAGALLGVGKYIKIRAEIDLTRSELEVLATALQQYHDDFGDFPFDTDTDGDGDSFDDSTGEFDYLEADLLIDLDGMITSGVLPEHPAVNLNPPPDTTMMSSASSCALFYFLDKNPNSRKIVDALTGSLVTNKDASGTTAIEFTFNVTHETISLPRFVDAWGNSLRYEYLPGTAFPIVTSAGPDGVMDTPDDVSSQ